MRGCLRFTLIIHRICAVIFGVILLYLVIPIWLLLSSPLLLYRRMIFLIAPFVRPDLGKIVSSGSAFANVDELYKSPRSKFIVSTVLEGSPKLDKLKDKVKLVFSTINPRTGDLLYPEMFQTVVQWMGYSFWKPVANFNFDEHVLYALEGSSATHEQAMRFIKDETLTPFQNDKPVWKFILIPDYIPQDSSLYKDCNQKYSLLIYTCEHILADGFAAAKGFMKLQLEPLKHVNEYAKQSSKAKAEMSRNMGTLLLRLPFDVGNWLIDALFVNKHFWNDRNKCADQFLLNEGVTFNNKADHNTIRIQEDSYAMRVSRIISFEDVRAVAKLHNVSTFSVITAGTVSALKNADVLMNDEIGKSRPKTLPYIVPIPLPGHPETLRNHRIMASFNIPITETDPVLRLKQIDEYLKITKYSSLPLFFHWCAVFLGCLPTSWQLRFQRMSQSSSSILLTSFPAPKHEMNLISENVVTKEISLMGAYSMNSRVLTMGLITHAGRVRLVVSVDKSVMSEHHAQRVCEGFSEALDEMRISPPSCMP